MDKSLSRSFLTFPSSSAAGRASKEETTGETDTRRLWIGNLDQKLSDGPYIGQPRGYAFVTYEDPSSALKCIQQLDSKRVMEKCVSVRWANQTTQTPQDEEEKIRSKIPALGIKPPEKPLSKSKAISAIEAKLRSMEGDTPNFSLSRTSLQTKQMKTPSSSSSASSSANIRSKPYNRNPSTSSRKGPVK